MLNLISFSQFYLPLNPLSDGTVYRGTVTQVDDIIDDDSLGNLFGVARSSKPKARTIDDILQDSSDDEIDKSYFKKKRKQSIIVESKKSHECTDKGNL